MQTLTNYQLLDKDLIMQGVYDWLFEFSGGLLAKMPVVEVSGNGIKYNVETAYPSATWVSTNDTIPESAGTYEQRSASISRLIGDIDVDKFAVAVNSTQNPLVVEMKRKLRGFWNEWADQLIHGQTTTSSTTKQPKGLIRLIAEIESESTTDLDGAALATTGNNSQVIAQNTTSGALTLAGMDILRDACKGQATHFIMSFAARRKLDALARAAGNNLVHDKDQLGYPTTRYGNQEIIINDHVHDNYPDSSSSVTTIGTAVKNVTRASGVDNTFIFAVRLAEDGFSIIQSGAMTQENIGTVQNKDAERHRVKWYNGLALFDKYSAAVLTSINPDS